MGAPSKRTEENATAILAALAEGHTKAAAAGAGGMSYQTFNEWTKDDPEFSEAVEKAEGVAKRRYLTDIASDKSWQSKAWILERRWPREFGRREAVEMSGPDGGPIDTRDLSALSDHEKDALTDAIQRELARRRGDDDAASGSEKPAEGTQVPG